MIDNVIDITSRLAAKQPIDLTEYDELIYQLMAISSKDEDSAELVLDFLEDEDKELIYKRIYELIQARKQRDSIR